MHGVITLPADAGQSLHDLAQRIQAEHQAAVAALRTSAEHAMAAGDLLIKAKGHVPHGQWGEWVERNCKMSHRNARTYMQLAQDREAVESKMAELGQFDLSIAGALKLISGPSKPKTRTTAAQPRPRSFPAGYDKSDSQAVACMWEIWDRLPAPERSRFFETIGLSAILDHIPEKWQRDVEAKLSTWKPWAEMPADYQAGDDLTIPDFLRREPEQVH